MRSQRRAGPPATAEALLLRGDVIRLRLGKLAARDPRDDVRLQEAISLATMRTGTAAPLRNSRIALRSAVGEVRRVDVAPLPPAPGSFPSASACIVLISSAVPAPDIAALLRASFGLTRAEAAMAIDLASSLSAREIAERRVLSWHTVRATTTIIFHKMGITKATQLAVIVARLGG